MSHWRSPVHIDYHKFPVPSRNGTKCENHPPWAHTVFTKLTSTRVPSLLVGISSVRPSSAINRTSGEVGEGGSKFEGS